jgi:hypothetical protein
MMLCFKAMATAWARSFAPSFERTFRTRALTVSFRNREFISVDAARAQDSRTRDAFGR